MPCQAQRTMPAPRAPPPPLPLLPPPPRERRRHPSGGLHARLQLPGRSCTVPVQACCNSARCSPELPLAPRAAPPRHRGSPLTPTAPHARRGGAPLLPARARRLAACVPALPRARGLPLGTHLDDALRARDGVAHQNRPPEAALAQNTHVGEILRGKGRQRGEGRQARGWASRPRARARAAGGELAPRACVVRVWGCARACARKSM